MPLARDREGGKNGRRPMERAGDGIAHLTRGSHHEWEPRIDGSARGMVRGRVGQGRARRRKLYFPASLLRLTLTLFQFYSDYRDQQWHE